MKLMDFVIGILVLVMGFGAGVLGARWQAGEPQDKLVVIDAIEWIQSVGDAPSDVDLKNVTDRVRSITKQLREQGYVVLDAASVMAAPARLYIRPGQAGSQP